MFRQPIVRLRRSVLPLFNGGRFRAKTSGPRKIVRPGPEHVQKAFWTTGRVLLFSAFTGTATYLYGINDASKLQLPWMKSIGPQYASKKVMEKAIEELRVAFGEDAISTDDEDLHRHGYSEWSSVNIDQLPVAVAYPKSTEEVSQLAKVCHKYRIPMIPYSGGSSLEANFAAPFGGMSIDFTFMDQVLTLHADDMDVVVQPSVPWMSLNDQIKDSGLFFPVDPGPSARIGGMVGTSCSGTNAVRYGTMKEWVINLTVVLADGTVIKTRKRPRKSSAGYNLTNLFVGSEGTLGIVTEITLKLAVIPQETSVAVVTFPTIRDAAAAASRVLRAGIPVAAMEIMDDVQMGVINKAGSTNRKWKEVPTMFFKFSGTKAGVRENIQLVKDISRKHKSGDFEFAKNAEEGKQLWSARKESLWSMMAIRREGDEVWSTDVAVPISRLPDIIEISKKEMDDLGLFASILGHIGDGNFHESIMYNSKDPKERAAVEKCVHDMVERALEMEGTCTGEHGIGLGKKASLQKELGFDTINVMRSIKGALDPYWLMNPGKIMDAKA
ncbi:D-lactate dehydrogenase mitochondrial precursor [Boeremia exigua]|uniref:D-lactate dehydrogenase mitochondrial precursor n=1 Tax=Boeremia exigua TaxID=749465 RepID=UPI001E8D3F88|nr:D-lactate dehydrogenase mitochondrial precursor [Boeremia exigua]KAH6620394.1 D-lactate dehydrogenase mitochondrial precursor [Boeremia exigua]